MEKPKQKDWRYTGNTCKCGGWIIYNVYTDNYICDNPECIIESDFQQNLRGIC